LVLNKNKPVRLRAWKCSGRLLQRIADAILFTHNDDEQLKNQGFLDAQYFAENEIIKCHSMSEGIAYAT
jgi:hypothetical protein